MNGTSEFENYLERANSVDPTRDFRDWEDQNRASDDGMPEAPEGIHPDQLADIRRGLADAQRRKDTPITTGVLDYFPDALLEVARVSKIGNDQHNPGEPLHWAREKSQDEADALVRHLLERGTFDTDGARHSGKVAWRALALLQKEIDADTERKR